MSVIHWGVTTAPRPRPCLAPCLSSWRAAGFDDQITIFSDGPCPDTGGDANRVIVVNDPPLRLLQNWRFAVATLLEKAGPYEFVAVMQDDSTWSLDSKRVLDEEIEKMGVAAHAVGYLSPYLDPKNAHELQSHGPLLRAGWHESKLGYESVGANCYIMPRQSAKRLLEDRQFKQFLATRFKNADNIVTKCLNDMGLKAMYRLPGLINHSLGAGNSSLKQKKPRDTAHWERQARRVI